MMYKMICQQCGCVFEAAVARKYCDDCVPSSHAGGKSKYKRVAGARYGMLTTLDFEQRQDKDQKRWYALCQCDCGVRKWVSWLNVATGKQQSCGCLQIKAAANGVVMHHKAKRIEIVEYAVANPTFSYRTIGEHFGITRERVRQVLLRELGKDGVVERKRARSVMSKETLDELERLRALVGQQQ